MAAGRLFTRVRCLVFCAGLMTVSPTGLVCAAEMSARIMLLPAGERASVVVEFDDEVPNATAIESTDNQSFDVEIGPVHSTVANQLLQAASQSPLVREVRVRAVAQGAQGTLITLHVTAKTTVSGLVRRAQRRVYVDLEPVSIASASKSGSRVMSTPTAITTPAQGSVNASAQPAAASTAEKPEPPRPPVPGTGSGMTSAGQTPTGVAPSTPLSPSPTLEEIQRRADVLAGQLDVKSLEKLKADWIARRASSVSGLAADNTSDPVVVKIDQYLDEARRKRLLADARLFNDSKPAADQPASAAPPAGVLRDEAFQRAITPLVPELEKMNAMLSQWQPGFVPAPNLPQSLEALTIRLRALQPPALFTAAHERLCAALGALAKSWVPGSDGVSLIPVGNDARLIVSTKGAIFDYLQLLAYEGPTGAGRSAPPRLQPRS